MKSGRAHMVQPLSRDHHGTVPELPSEACGTRWLPMRKSRNGSKPNTDGPSSTPAGLPNARNLLDSTHRRHGIAHNPTVPSRARPKSRQPSFRRFDALTCSPTSSCPKSPKTRDQSATCLTLLVSIRRPDARPHRSSRTSCASVRPTHFVVYCRLNSTLGR